MSDSNEVLITLKVASADGVKAITEFLAKVKQFGPASDEAAKAFAVVDGALDSLVAGLRRVGSSSAEPLAELVGKFQAGELSAQKLMAGIEELASVSTEEFQAIEEGAVRLGETLASIGPIAERTGGELAAVFERAGQAIADAEERSSASSANFGQGLAASTQRARAALLDLEAEMRRTAESGGAITPEQVAEARRLEEAYQAAILKLRELEAAQRQATAAAVGAKAPVDTLAASISRATSYVELLIAQRLASELRSWVTSSLDAARSVERIHLALVQATGSSADADKEFEFLKRTADTLGIPLQGLAEKYARLDAAGRGTKLTTQELRTLFVGMGAAAASFGDGEQRIEAGAKALEQVLSSDITNMGSLRRQLENVLPGAFTIAADAFGYGRERLDEFEAALKHGEIRGEEFVQRLGPALVNHYGQELPAAVDTSTASMNRLANAEFLASAGFGQRLAPAVKEASAALVELLDHNKEAIKGEGDIAALLIRGADALVSYFRQGVLGIEELGYAALGGLARTTVGLGDILNKLHLLPEVEREGIEDLRAWAAALSEEGQHAGAEMDELAKNQGKALDRSSAKTHEEVGKLVADYGTVPPAFDAAGSAIARGFAKTSASVQESIAKIKSEIGDGGNVTAAQAARIVKDIGKIRTEVEELPEAEREALASQLSDLEKVRAGYEATAAVALNAFGVQTPESIRESVTVVETLAKAFGPLGQATKEQADKVIAETQRILNEIALEPPAQRAAMADMVVSLQRLQDEYRQTGAEIHAAFGLKTPEDIGRATEALRSLVAAYGPAESATKENAEVVSKSAREILTDIGKLPAGERDALAAQTSYLRQLDGEYSKVATTRKAFYVDAAAEAKEAAAGLKQYVDQTIASLDRLEAKLREADAEKKKKADDDRAALQKEYDQLDQGGPLTQDQENRYNELHDLLGQAADQGSSLQKSIRGLGDENERTTASVDDANEVLRTQIQIFENNRSAFEKLGDQGQETFEVLSNRFQQTAKEGELTADVVADEKQSFLQLAQQAGVSSDQIDQAMNNASGSALDLGVAFKGLRKDASATGEAFGGIAKGANAMLEVDKRASGVNQRLRTMISLLKDGKRAAEALGNVSL